MLKLVNCELVASIDSTTLLRKPKGLLGLAPLEVCSQTFAGCEVWSTRGFYENYHSHLLAPAKCSESLDLRHHGRAQVSGNHRLEDNKAEQKRLTELGRELSSSAVEGRPVGPLRVWPGGLAMSRTLGDAEVSRVHRRHTSPGHMYRSPLNILSIVKLLSFGCMDQGQLAPLELRGTVCTIHTNGAEAHRQKLRH